MKALGVHVAINIDQLVAKNQRAFIRGGAIQDNFMLASQSVDHSTTAMCH